MKDTNANQCTPNQTTHFSVPLKTGYTCSRMTTPMVNGRGQSKPHKSGGVRSKSEVKNGAQDTAPKKSETL